MTDNLIYTTQTPEPSAQTSAKAHHHKCSHHELSPSRVVRVGAEFAGSTAVMFAIYALSTWGTIINSTSVLALVGLGTALAYAAASLIFGRASGGHFNPAVTFAGILTGVTQWLDGVLYIIAQVLGALAAAGVWYLVTPTSQSITHKTWFGIVVNGFDSNNPAATLLGQNAGLSFGIQAAIAVELIFTIVVVAAFFSTVRSNGAPHKNHVMAIAAAYGVGAMVSYLVDGAGLNPARATGIAVFGATNGMATNPLTQLWVFWVTPLVAAAVVAFGFIIRDSVRAQRAETAAAVEALRAEKEAEAEAETEAEAAETDVPEVTVETTEE
ncbi:hypothetical protein B9G54_00185 [Alloscardovia macacae]|uniref:Glycerol transporter n=1 Tax=Alloscardovia macacae TaxID=1160091 RepID=A0A1Y2SW46_9BIFI|nr:aquaporin [Alloscardovia macacae]OTA27528.1 hypothetical protein B9G54_00185 [Alloscardovia macacae]OTA30176.1 hypothetical protein B9T39_00265 [Alloscardovia macacae]